MSSTFSRVVRAISSRSARACTGAMVKPQLPATTVVTPWKHRRREGGVPEHLGVVVGVDVDEAGSDDAAGGVQHDVTREALTDRHDATTGDRDVGADSGRSCAVDDGAPGDDDDLIRAVAHCKPPRRRLEWAPESLQHRTARAVGASGGGERTGPRRQMSRRRRAGLRNQTQAEAPSTIGST